MNNGTEQGFRFRFSLRGLLIALFVFGAGFGVLGQLFRQSPQIFSMVIFVLSTIVPYICAVSTIFWISARRRNSGLFLWGILLVAVPFIGGAVIALSQRYVGTSPGNLGMLSTQELIEVRLPKEVDTPSVWRELEKRLRSGKLMQEEADAAVGQLVKHMKSTKPQGWDQPLSWQQDFVGATIQKGLLSDSVKFDLCDAFYGTVPIIERLPRVREGDNGFDIDIQYGSNWSDHTGIDLSLLWQIDRALLDGEPVKFEQHYKHGERWSGFYEGTPAVGEHELTIELTCAYVAKPKLLGLDADSLSPKRWPNAAKQWKRTVSAPLIVYTSDEPLVRLSTNPELDPSRGVTVKRCVVQAAPENKKKVILEMNVSADISMSCDVTITLAGNTVPIGSRWVAHGDGGRSYSGGSSLTAVIESLDDEIEYADITLTPAPEHIEQRPDVTEIWGKPITLFSVPIERLDLELLQTNE